LSLGGGDGENNTPTLTRRRDGNTFDVHEDIIFFYPGYDAGGEPAASVKQFYGLSRPAPQNADEMPAFRSGKLRTPGG